MYCNLTDLTRRLAAEHVVALADDDGDGVADAGPIEAAIADADAEIDARLAPRYRTPFDPAPAVVRSLSATLAIARLYARRREALPEDFRETLAAARRLLDDLAAGRAEIREAGRSFGRAVSDSTVRGEERLFDRPNLELF